MKNNEYFYQRLPIEILGSFYYYIQEKISMGKQLPIMYRERKKIELVAKQRNISLMELHFIGRWFIQKENFLLENEEERE